MAYDMNERRAGWEFQYPAKIVRKAAEEKREHHRGRKSWWEEQRRDAEAKLKESGWDVRENRYTGGSNFEAVIDSTLAKRLNECNQKIEHHLVKSEEYAAWERALSKSTGALTLRIGDVVFFGL